ncbi:MAG TPA: sialate O-acetylesterase [Opitutaceae bacterium]
MPASAANPGTDFTVPSDKAAFHIFLLAGQSNMAGRGDVGPQDTAPIPRVLALGKDAEWRAAVDPIHLDKPVAGVGLARSFAVAYLDDHPGVTVGFVPAACGGSPIAMWTPGAYFEQTDSHPYDDAIARTRVALERGTLKGILWHQGESDCHPGLSEVYADALADLIARFRSEFDAGDVPFVVGQLGRFEGAPWGEHTKEVDAAHRAIAASTPRAAFVSSEGLTSKPDNIHFNSASLHEFGLCYYTAFRKLEKTSQ